MLINIIYPGHVGGSFVCPYVNCQLEVSIGPANGFLLVLVGEMFGTLSLLGHNTH